ncbi:MAG: formate--tetrahydrofolate ligase [Clostridiaceae bacterium]|nr:formate--tetrahydrofolate ligase [Bacillota bacterium]NLN51765.1 formate--tetrahydrofolate ligase [Clostridiaceae bacterium]
MTQLSDIEIAQKANLQPIQEIAQKAGIPTEDLELYGKYKAKVNLSALKSNFPDKKLILVTAISPTSAGEGKTTVSVGLGDALRMRNKNSAIALREPSLGPVFGVKGGAAGGGYAQVLPMDDLNLHFTGDFHAIGAANNLLAAMLDNHIHHGNSLNIDPRRIVWKRCVDMNDRQLRKIVDGLGNRVDGVPRQDGFDITVASEIMAVFCLANSVTDLKERLGKMIVAYNYQGKPVLASDLKAEGAMAVLLKDALKPNLVQTIEGTPAYIHGGPFANIAHGCNSILATKMALSHHDYTVTEAGFGSDLGAEKFLDIKCRNNDLIPNAVVLVATVRALKKHGGLKNEQLNQENISALQQGMPNLLRHISVLSDVFNTNVVVAVNRFPTDTEAELDLIKQACQEVGINACICEVWARGGQGGLELADQVIKLSETQSNLSFAYSLRQGIKEKISELAKNVYKADGVDFTKIAKEKISNAEQSGYGNLPICMAKTQYSFSDNPELIAAPDNFKITVRDIRVSAGAGFIVALTGTIMTMPGLPKIPVAENIDIDAQGIITGLM